MNIAELHVINFRNLRFVRTEFATGLNLVYGPNAQGKTNLLEAIYLLVTGRSFRTPTEREMIPWDREQYEATLVRARVHKGGYEERFLLTFNQADKNVFVNGNPIRRLGDLIGRINAVLFTPSDLQIVRGAPAGRRRFLDIDLSQINHAYLRHLQSYDLALRQRNALLKQCAARAVAATQLPSWDAQLAEHGSEILAFRASMLSRLSELVGQVYSGITGGSERLELIYEPSPKAAVDSAQGVLQGLIQAELERSRADDIRRGATSVGPHRDDFSFRISGRDARDFGSQGQQRSCVLALKLAELELMRQATGEWPVLLLDDLMSELDESRKRAFLAALPNGVQAILTATEANLVAPFATPAASFRVEGGEVLPD